ncbi:MAG: kynurenine formamidase [Gammaproteobacteria bacterium]|jgi:kynurenine formamidase
MTECIHDHSRWTSQWGANDRIGAGNLLTAQRRLNALGLVSEGQVIDLGHVIENEAPRILPNQTPFVMTLSARAPSVVKRRAAMGAENEIGTTLERIEMTTHVGTHIDALGHVTVGDRMYNGLSANSVLDDFGLTELGVENIPPIITRGVLLDVAGLDGGERLEAGRAITPAELERAQEAAGVKVGEGDVVCINTGWGALFMTDNAAYVAGEPGIDVDAAKWLTARGVVAIGADNMAVEVLPNPKHPRLILPVHQHALVDSGVYLIENLKLDALAQARRYEFCFVLLATKFKGATGCPVRPVAMF